MWPDRRILDLFGIEVPIFGLVGETVAWVGQQTYAENPNADALRWGTMRTFWFDADRPPAPGAATLRRSQDPTRSLAGTEAAPKGGCAADRDHDRDPNSTDISAFLATWLAEVTDESFRSDVNGDHVVNSADIAAFLAVWLEGVQGGC